MRRLLAVLAVLLCALTASAQVVVTPANPQGWQFTASSGVGNVPPPASYLAPGFETPPLGIGSVHLTPGQDGNDSAQTRQTLYSGTLLSAITALSYSTFTEVDGSGGQSPYIILDIDTNGDTTVDDRLFFEPVYQTGAYSGDPVPNQGALVTDTWQTWNARIGGWWSFNAATFGPPLVTLDTYIAANPTARIMNPGANGGVRIVTGGGAGAWDNYLGAADNFTIGVSGVNTTYDFEPAASTIITVTPAALDGWTMQVVDDDGDTVTTGSTSFVSGPGTPPMGTGSLQFNLGTEGEDGVQARNNQYDGLFIRDLSELTYSTYVQTPGSGGQTPYIILDVDLNNDGVRDDLWFFEPVYQDGTFCPENPQPAVAVGTWQTWDASNGCWYSLFGTAGTGPGANVAPLSVLLDTEPDARLSTNITGGSFRVVTGFGDLAWDNFVGNTDAVNIAFSGTTTIYDFEPTPSIGISDLSQFEGTGTTTNFVVTLTLSEPVSQTVTVNYSTADGTATVADGDYTPVVNGTATFTPGTTSTTVTIVVNADAKFELDEDFFINLTNPQFATVGDPQARVVILNDDLQPTIAIGNVSLSEGNTGITPPTPFTFTVSLSNPSHQNISVNWITTPGTAMTPEDFIAGAGTLVIPAGSTSGQITVDVVGDLVAELSETFTVDLSVPVNATIADPQGLGTIINNDSEPRISTTDVTLPEGNAVTTPFTFVVTLSHPSAFPVTVNWVTVDDTAVSPSDYVDAEGTLIFAPGDVSETITVSVIGDLAFEDNEVFFISFTGEIGATLLDRQGFGTIVNDDGPVADVSITKGAPGTAVPGSQITYNILVSNAGPQTASNVVVTDTIPAGTTFVSATPSQGTCSFAAPTVTCNLGAVASGGSATIALTVVTPTSPQTITNTATVVNTPETDPTPGNNTSPAAVTALAQATGIPTVSEWGLLALLAALMAAAVLKLR
jgi:uncharacterized repeat protein (TIGR01451 family)